ncbi:MAG: hypothetical protein GC178_05855 [Flavobacteriales bacterium]|nr:hypothetical protein [Flavobacteriales bacterium]
MNHPNTPSLRVSLRNHQAPGDILMLSAALRDLHLAYPGRFITDVETTCPDIWINNPYVTALDKKDRSVKKLRCEYPLIHQSDKLPYHFVHGFIQFLNEQLQLDIRPTAFRGDLHLSEEEKNENILSQYGVDGPFWLMNAGGKNDFTIKWWDAKRYQEVVDHFKGRIQFVQVGANEHYHPELKGVIDLRGKTTVRELIRLAYHADGVVTPVSFLMHLAAAIVPKHKDRTLKPCVVIAGGREPVHWEQYPGHQYIHTIGALSCCNNAGCWKSRTVKLNDGSPNDRPENLCVNVVQKTSPSLFLGQTKNRLFQGGEFLPRCMDMITADEVIRRVEFYFEGGTLEYSVPLSQSSPHTTPEAKSSRQPIMEPVRTSGYKMPKRLTEKTAQKEIDTFIRTLHERTFNFNGRGIVICGGGEKYFPGTWVLVNMLRYLGCKLPVEVWYLGKHEMDNHMQALLAPLDVACIDATIMRKEHPCRILKGWELKAYALLHSSFKEVMLLDADNVPTINPEELFDWPEYKKTGCIFWPDVNKLSKGRQIWDLIGVPYRDEPEFESGQILVHKGKCLDAVILSLWINEYSDFYYNYIHGDKETFHMAFRKLKTNYAMTRHHVVLRQGVMYQHDFRGKVVFQHRNGHKWSMNHNPRLNGFQFEDECIAFVELLGNIWSGKIGSERTRDKGDKKPNTDATKELISSLWYYERVGYDRRPMVFHPDGTIRFGGAAMEKRWNFDGKAGELRISGDSGVTCSLKRSDHENIWNGRWLQFEQMPIKLIGINKPKNHEV